MPERQELLKKYLFSPCAQRIVIEHATKIARKYGSDRIEPLHILLGITQEKSSKVRGTDYEGLLHLQGSSRDRLRQAAKAELERMTFKVSKANMPYSPEAHELLRLSYTETDDNNDIHTAHLLLGILRLDEDDPAYRVLHRQGVHMVRTRRLIAVH
jgi:ATP-dependent Clp protease ATP-binding subunit ClpA